MAGLAGSAPALPSSLGAACKLLLRPLRASPGEAHFSSSPKLSEFLKSSKNSDLEKWGFTITPAWQRRQIGGSHLSRGPAASPAASYGVDQSGYSQGGRSSYGQGKKSSRDGVGAGEGRTTRRRGEKKSRQMEGRRAFRETFLAALEAEKVGGMYMCCTPSCFPP